MGPRLIGRGKAIYAEMPSSLCEASMGPRLIGRGKPIGENASGSDRTASMGPRLIGRGKAEAARTTPAHFTGFNGAAADWPRKEVHCIPPVVHRLPLQWGRG